MSNWCIELGDAPGNPIEGALDVSFPFPTARGERRSSSGRRKNLDRAATAIKLLRGSSKFFFCRVLQVIRDRWTPRFAIVRKPSVACRGTQDKKYSAKSGQSGRWPRHLKPQGPELMHTARRHDEPWSQALLPHWEIETHHRARHWTTT